MQTPEQKQKNYLAQKKQKKKSALKVVWVLVFLGIAFVAIVVKFAFSGDIESIISGEPSSDEVYSAAKLFIEPTLKGSSPTYSDSQYQFGRPQDSVYVIRSFVTTKDNAGDVERTTFKITLKYKGGARSNQNSWELLNLNED